MQQTPEKNTGQWIAQISAFAAVVAILLGFILRGRAMWFTTAIVGAGFVLSIVALISISKFGPKGIALRGAVGLFLNGVVLMSMIVHLSGWGLPPAPDHATHLPGTWQTEMPTPDGPATLTFSFRKDGTGSMRGEGSHPSDLDLTWRVDRRVLYIKPTTIRQGDPATLAQEQPVGLLYDVDAAELKLRNSMSDEVYTRQPTTSPSTKPVP